MMFLQLISDIIQTRMPELDAAFGFSKMNTPPLLWLIAIARTLNVADRPVLERYLSRGTSASLPIWNTLSMTSTGLSYAVPIFMRVRGYYDSATEKSIAAMLHVSAAKAAAKFAAALELGPHLDGRMYHRGWKYAWQRSRDSAHPIAVPGTGAGCAGQA